MGRDIAAVVVNPLVRSKGIRAPHRGAGKQARREQRPSTPAVVLLGWFLNSSAKFGHARLRLDGPDRGDYSTAGHAASPESLPGSAHRTLSSTLCFTTSANGVAQRTRPGEYFFGDHQIAFTLRLRNAARVAFLPPTDYTRPEEVEDAIEALQKFQVRRKLVYRPGSRRTPLVAPRATISRPYDSIFTSITVWLKRSPTEIRCRKGRAEANGTAGISPDVCRLRGSRSMGRNGRARWLMPD